MPEKTVLYFRSQYFGKWAVLSLCVAVLVAAVQVYVPVAEIVASFYGFLGFSYLLCSKKFTIDPEVGAMQLLSALLFFLLFWPVLFLGKI